MQQEEFVPLHSVRGYLSRQSTETLEAILRDFLQDDTYKSYIEATPIILDILKVRFVSDTTLELCARAKALLAEYKKKDD